MSILLSNEIKNAVVKELESAKESVQIITAYCKANSFNYLDAKVPAEVEKKRLLLRFRKEDIVNNSTDFEVVELGLDAGWEVFIRFDLHAKTYIVDDKRGLVGSANATIRGLNIGKQGNMEIGTLVNIEPSDIFKINNLFANAIRVTPSLVATLKSQLTGSNDASNSGRPGSQWSDDIIDLFKPTVDTLFSYQLPDKPVFQDGDFIDFLEIHFNNNLSEVKEAFRWSPAYLWLLDVLRKNNNCAYFGLLSAELHRTLVSDPKPYRKDVKMMLSNLLALIEALNMDEIIIDKPNYSQRIRLK